MFDYLNEINPSLYNRYITLEGNIKTKSNSFYDSYLDLLESTLKVILDNGGIEYKKDKTFGYILRSNEVKEYLISTIQIELHVYEKMFDYAKKVNDHKHKKEKNVTVDSVINLMQIYYDFSSCYAKFIGIKNIEDFDRYYFYRSFDATGKENLEILHEVKKLKEQVEEVKLNNEGGINDEDASIKRHKQFLKDQISDDYVKNSKKTYYTYLNDKQLLKKKIITCLISLIELILDIVLSFFLINSICSGPFTFFYSAGLIMINAGMITIILQNISIFISKTKIEDYKFKNICTKSFYKTRQGIYIQSSSFKMGYNMISICMLSVSLIVAILYFPQDIELYIRIIFAIGIIIYNLLYKYIYICVDAIFSSFFIIKLDGSAKGERKILFLDANHNITYEEEDGITKYPFLKD